MHIFYIHSHITYVLAQLIILDQKIGNKDVRYITSRSYVLNVRNKTFNITDFYSYLETASRVNKVFQLKSKINNLDENITLLSDGKPFKAYLPQFNHSLFQIIGTHELCESVLLVEEGITSYKIDKCLYESNGVNTIQYLSSIFSKRFLLKNNHYKPYPIEKFEYAVCISNDCFPFIDKKRVLKIDDNIVANYKNTIENGSVVFVLDSFKERTHICEAEYFKIIKGTLNLNSASDKLFIKFHPEQNKIIRKKTLRFIKENFSFESVICIDDDCILEFEFLKSKNLTVLGMHTSLLYYAKRFGHHVLSSIKLTSSLPEVNVYIDHIMDKEQKEEYLSYE